MRKSYLVKSLTIIICHFIFAFIQKMYKVNIFAILGIMFLSSILLGNGMYSNQIFAIEAQNENNHNKNGNLNEAEVNADIEQENKCKKDTECENENELNNQLSITNITQITAKPQTTLNVIKIVECFVESQQIDCNPLIPEPEDFQITVNGNSPNPSQFPGSPQGTLVTLGAGGYTVSEENNGAIPPNVNLIAEFSGDCEQSDDFEAEGTIAEDEHQTCTITNIFFSNL